MDKGRPCPSICGYNVRVVRREAFTVAGYTLILPGPDSARISGFWDEVIADGRLARLRACSPVRPWALGLGSWDPECPKGGQRYTVCIEETPETDTSQLSARGRVIRKEIGASDWLCFRMIRADYPARFWEDNPYQMMKALGYRFHTGRHDYSVGLHLEGYPPEYDDTPGAPMEFSITVAAGSATIADAESAAGRPS